MNRITQSLLALVFCAGAASAQTADELIAKNIAAKGGIDKIKAIKTLRVAGRYQSGGFKAKFGQVATAESKLRNTFTMQGMTEIDAYDGAVGWKISPFEGRKDPEIVGEDSLRDLQESADFYGHLVDYKEKGSKVEYLGHDQVDGDDAYRLKLTLKNGDIIYYFLDPDTFLEIRTETQQFLRGAVHESVQGIGSYKKVAGVYFPFSFESGAKGQPDLPGKSTIETIEVNGVVDDSEFKMPSTPEKK